MQKREFIEWLLTLFGTTNAARNQAYMDLYVDNLRENIDFDSLKKTVSMEWDKSTMPPAKWLLERKRDKYKIKDEKEYWNIEGITEAGYTYVFACEMTETLKEAQETLKKRGLKYAGNNRAELGIV